MPAHSGAKSFFYYIFLHWLSYKSLIIDNLQSRPLHTRYSPAMNDRMRRNFEFVGCLLCRRLSGNFPEPFPVENTVFPISKSPDAFMRDSNFWSCEPLCVHTPKLSFVTSSGCCRESMSTTNALLFCLSKGRCLHIFGLLIFGLRRISIMHSTPYTSQDEPRTMVHSHAYNQYKSLTRVDYIEMHTTFLKCPTHPPTNALN